MPDPLKLAPPLTLASLSESNSITLGEPAGHCLACIAHKSLEIFERCRLKLSALLILKLLAQAVGQQMKERRVVLSDANQISLIFRPLA